LQGAEPKLGVVGQRAGRFAGQGQIIPLGLLRPVCLFQHLGQAEAAIVLERTVRIAAQGLSIIFLGSRRLVPFQGQSAKVGQSIGQQWIVRPAAMELSQIAPSPLGFSLQEGNFSRVEKRRPCQWPVGLTAQVEAELLLGLGQSIGLPQGLAQPEDCLIGARMAGILGEKLLELLHGQLPLLAVVEPGRDGKLIVSRLCMGSSGADQADAQQPQRGDSPRSPQTHL